MWTSHHPHLSQVYSTVKRGITVYSDAMLNLMLDLGRETEFAALYNLARYGKQKYKGLINEYAYFSIWNPCDYIVYDHSTIFQLLDKFRIDRDCFLTRREAGTMWAYIPTEFYHSLFSLETNNAGFVRIDRVIESFDHMIEQFESGQRDLVTSGFHLRAVKQQNLAC